MSLRRIGLGVVGALALCVMCLSSAQAASTTVLGNNKASSYNYLGYTSTNTYTENGFTIVISYGGMQPGNNTGGSGTGNIDVAGGISPCCAWVPGGGGGIYTYVVTETDGGSFTFSSLNVGDGDVDPLLTQSVLVTGAEAGGGTISQTLYGAGAPTAQTAAAFSNVALTSLTLSNFSTFAAPTPAYLACYQGLCGASINNLVLNANAVTSVPEPASMVVLGVALAGLAFCRKARFSA